ncbi:MAG TPA: DegQ family serine endoprotease [Candidatus Acidoferrales bacterium]|nr:DegQ family serine endoprotease [Candidatus Acidoferrales bacterium]
MTRLVLNPRYYLHAILALSAAVASTAHAVNMVPESFSSVAKQAKPAVVNIFSTRVVRVPGSTGDPAEDFFRQFFGQGLPYRAFRQQSLGSGFIISADGYVVTNAHVVGQAEQIRVKLTNREEYDAKLVGMDQKTDVALIKIKPRGELPVLPLGNSEALEVGDWVVAIGNPFGFSATVTAGIVSAKDRVIGAGPYDDFIQTDASINPGNSGGPLLDLKGEVIGINSAIYSRSGGNVGIGFAIPINLARKIIDELRGGGRVARGWIGVNTQDMSSEIAESLGLDRARGALVTDVTPEGPADRAGIERGDVIVAVNGSAIEESRQLGVRLAETPIGKSAELTVLRNGKELALAVTVGEQPGTQARNKPSLRRGGWGLSVADLTADLMRRFDIPRGVRGAMISEVVPGGAAEAAGLQPGDVIRQVNRQPVTSARSCQQAFERAGDKLLLLIQRGESSGYLVVERPEADEGNEQP